jgi:excisionase family DNA binding protein
MSETVQIYFSPDELAARWGMSTKWVRNQIYADRLKAVKFGTQTRVHADEVQRFERSRASA